jgi:hypothetical protein
MIRYTSPHCPTLSTWLRTTGAEGFRDHMITLFSVT